MKKLLIASALSSLLALNAYGEQSTGKEKWVGGFVEYYSTDHEEIGYPNYLDNGMGLGVEFGLKLTPKWGARVEASHLSIDASPSDESGNRLGVDAMYFLPDNLLYGFAGLKYTKIVDGGMMANLGLGKHWNLSDNLKIVTEVAAYQMTDGENHTHVGYKAGLVYSFGSSASSANTDNDNDGVSDSQDNCPNTPYNTVVDAYGCAKVSSSDEKKVAKVGDADQDGVLDDKDQCAGTPTTDKVDRVGCSVFMEEQVSVDLNVSFGNNSSVIANPDDSKFQEFADFMKRFPATDTVIEGHASAPGDDAYNMKLSQDRANAVKALLVDDFGIDAARLSAVGFGETQLLDTSNTAAAHKANRRITAKVSASNRVRVER